MTFYEISLLEQHKLLFKRWLLLSNKNQLECKGRIVLRRSKFCEIVSNELISKQDLVRRLVNQGYETTIDEHHADF